MTDYIVVQPRDGVDADEVIDWLSENFQWPGSRDDGLRAKEQRTIIEESGR